MTTEPPSGGSVRLGEAGSFAYGHIAICQAQTRYFSISARSTL